MSPGVNTGRPRKPAALKKLAGTLRKDRSRKQGRSPAPMAFARAVPRDLSPLEVECWRNLARIVDPTKVATNADLVAFRQMAITVAVIEQARKDLQEADSLTYEVHTESGTVIRKRPEVEIMATFKKQLSAELSRFGLTPADREKVPVLADDVAQDPLDEFSQGLDS